MRVTHCVHLNASAQENTGNPGVPPDINEALCYSGGETQSNYTCYQDYLNQENSVCTQAREDLQYIRHSVRPF